MKQLLRSARTGKIEVSEVPIPQLAPGKVLVRNLASLASAGTERALGEFAEKNLLQKAVARPDLVRHVVEKARRDGILSAWGAIRNRLDEPLAMGYSSAGRVIGVGEGITDLQIGDAVACAGFGYAAHAEVVSVPRLLVALIPRIRVEENGVEFEQACFATLGAIAMHAIRLAEAQLGDVVAVIGLGLLGQIIAQLLSAAGCRVVGMDLQAYRVDLAKSLGADAVATSAAEMRALCSRISAGADAVLIAAETPSNDPVTLAAEIARDRGRVVAVGAVGMNVPRKLYYDKELEFRVSRSYGPGRYDPEYEEHGHDYPIGFVRWTENRNLEAFVRMLVEGKLNLKPLITHRFSVDRAADAYDLIAEKSQSQVLGVVITYAAEGKISAHVDYPRVPVTGAKSVSVGMLGAGSFATGTLLPTIKKIDGLALVGICTANGRHGNHAARKFGFRYCTTAENEIFDEPGINTVAIVTPHHLHASQVNAAVRAKKNVFCEKPLCLGEGELAEIVRVQYSAPAARLMVGYNRRFAPMAVKLKEFVASIKAPLVMNYRVNAGSIPAHHWVLDPQRGGGRILSEACHFLDFFIFLSAALPVKLQARSLSDAENVLVHVQFADGSLGNLIYVTNGDKSFSKERLEVFGGESAAVLQDFRFLDLVRQGRRKVFRSRFRQDKGHRGEWEAYVNAIETGAPSPIAFVELVAGMLATLRITESLRSDQAVEIDTADFISSSLAASAEFDDSSRGPMKARGQSSQTQA
jgi:predicted dehydrogenase